MSDKRYSIGTAYYKTFTNVWVYAQVLYDNQLRLFVNPDGSICTRVSHDVPHGELMHHEKNKNNDVRAIKLPDRLLARINDEYELYQMFLENYIKT